MHSLQSTEDMKGKEQLSNNCSLEMPLLGKPQGKVRIPTLTRSEGDGMENSPTLETENIKPSKLHVYEFDTNKAAHQSPAFSDLPVSVKRKEPKFVPYEPYKAAVSPIIPEITRKGKSLHDSKKGKSRTKSKSCVSLAETCIPFPLLSSNDYLFSDKNSSTPIIRVLREINLPDRTTVNNEPLEDKIQWEKEKQELQDEIYKVKEEKKELETQFKIQTQVNAELKKLLVAAVGEDMQARVQFLSEDKAQLAEDIAHYSQLLLEDHEELERLSIQCDVWRSKFLASSLMVDELAGWKALLSEKYQEASEAVHSLLVEHQEMLKQLITTNRCLLQIREAFDPVASHYFNAPSQSYNIMHLVQNNKYLVEGIRARLLGSVPSKLPNKETAYNFELLRTPAEELSLKVLASKDIAQRISALEGESGTRGGHPPDLLVGSKTCPLLPHMCHNELTVNCCNHCSGEIKLI